MYVCMYVCMYVYIYVCVCVCGVRRERERESLIYRKFTQCNSKLPRILRMYDQCSDPNLFATGQNDTAKIGSQVSESQMEREQRKKNNVCYLG